MTTTEVAMTTAGVRGVSRRWAIVWVLMAGTFAVSTTITVLVVHLEKIAGELNSSVSVMMWAITGPMLAFGVVGPAFGKMGDLWGHRRVFLSGLFAAGVFTALSALSWNAATLIAFRTLAATAGSACGPSSMAYINQLFPGSERVRPIAYASFVAAVAPVFGVVLGGPLVDHFDWQVIFIGQAPLCFVAFGVAAWLLPPTERQRDVRFDLWGSVTFGLGATLLLAGISQGRSWGWASPATAGCFVGAAALLLVFVAIERRVSAPLVVLDWFRTRNFAVPMVAQLLSSFAYMGSFFLIPQVLGPRGVGLSGTAIGNLVVSRPLALSLLAPVAASMTIRVGERVAGVVGMMWLVLSMALWSTVGTSTGALFIVLATSLTGVGAAIYGPSLTSLMLGAVEPSVLGVASAMQQLASQLGSVLGSTVLATVSATAAPGNLSPFRWSFVVATAVAATAGACASFVRSSDRLRP